VLSDTTNRNLTRTCSILCLIASLQVDFPVPDLLAFTDDSSVIGTPFYVMQFVTYEPYSPYTIRAVRLCAHLECCVHRGRIFTDPSLPGVPPEERTALFEYVGLQGD
jgi:hypothetical protein